MERKGAIIFTLMLVILMSCSAPDNRVDFNLQYTETGDQATNPQKIAPNLWAIFMHNYQYRVFVKFDMDDQRFRKGMTCVLTLKNAEGNTYTESYTMEKRLLTLAAVDDDRHMRLMQDDMISIEINDHVYKLYDPQCVKRVLRQMYDAAEKQTF
jgi:hypothetical protein